jgi:hypothetical protein
MLYLSRPNPRLGLQDSFSTPLLDSNQTNLQSLPPSKSLIVQEFSESADGNDIEKWFNHRQSLWVLTYFCEPKSINDRKSLYSINPVRRCEHSFASTIDAIAKETTPSNIGTLTNMYHDGEHVWLCVTLIATNLSRHG